jgi:hypothetical protein
MYERGFKVTDEAEDTVAQLTTETTTARLNVNLLYGISAYKRK